MLHRAIILLGVILTSLIPVAGRAADIALEYPLKAAFIYNFATFTDWPAATGNTLHLCVAGKNPFGNALDSLEGKMVGNMRVKIKLSAEGESLRSCQVLFISAAEQSNIGRLLEEIKGVPVLTVAEGAGMTQQGVIIALFMEQKRITFEVNLEAARRARLNISSRLLRLARVVY